MPYIEVFFNLIIEFSNSFNTKQIDRDYKIDSSIFYNLLTLINQRIFLNFKTIYK